MIHGLISPSAKVTLNAKGYRSNVSRPASKSKPLKAIHEQ